MKTRYHESSRESLVLVQRYVNEILNQAKYTSAFMATLPEVKGAMGKWTRYFEQDKPTPAGAVATDPSEILIKRMCDDMMSAHPDFAYVYMGFEDGGYTQNAEEVMATDYDPRRRPWYTQSKQSATDTTLLSAYITTQGVPNIGVTTKIYNDSGKFIGVSAVDISLGDLTEIVSNLKIGETGYVMLVQNDGTILSDPHHSDNNFKKIGDVEGDAYKRISNTADGDLDNLELDGVGYDGVVLTSKETGWKLAALVETSEINAAANQTIINVLIIGCIVVLVFGVLGGLYATVGVVRPIRSLVDMTKDIAAGNYDSLPDAAKFKSEFAVLFENMRTMVKELVKTISLAEDKTREAEVKSAQANEALDQAEDARCQAESAKTEGMLQAAQQLEEIVEQISSASTELSAQIEESKRGSNEQRNMASENATAMEQMNASVIDVASSASKSSDSAMRTKEEARSGSEIVDQVVSSVGTLVHETDKLSQEMEQLGSQAESIGNVMNVITDIADQTNLLALNAAIEAARAGEAGRGFAVVADEVRKLAEKTMGATKEVGAAIHSIQDSTAMSIDSMQETRRVVESTTSLATQAGEALGNILQLVDEVAGQVQSIASAAEEQSAASEEIKRGTGEISRIAEETAHAMDESAVAMEQLARLSNKLSQLIDGLKNIGEGP
ncbi:methyl-accepting chemotaxis protein [Oceanidesulfovibrio marinus]|nr:methyl-accepting chemotaxis protein [Oceanidesulfovibrio marinus]